MKNKDTVSYSHKPLADPNFYKGNRITRDMPSVTDNIKMFTGLDKFEGLIKKYQDNPSILGILYEELNIVSCIAEELKQDIKQKISLENYLSDD